jgi:hypothetical protein
MVPKTGDVIKLCSSRKTQVREHWQLGDWYRYMPQRESKLESELKQNPPDEDPVSTPKGMLLTLKQPIFKWIKGSRTPV